MTQILAEVPETPHVGDGSTTTFDIGFSLPVAAHLVVTVDGALQTQGADYTVAGSNVVFTVAPAAAAPIAFRRRTPVEQLIEFPGQPTMTPRAVEQALNERARQAQDLDAKADRSIKVPVGEPGFETPLAGDRAGAVFAFDDEGEPDFSKTIGQIVQEAGALVGADALAQVVAEGTTQSGLVAAAGTTQIGLVAAAGSTQVALVAAAGVDGVEAMAEAAETQIANVAAVYAASEYPTNDAALSDGVHALASLVAGSGGTDGTFALAFTGGAGSGAAGVFTVAGGAVASVLITATGHSYTSAPTVSFAASAGLTGASATAVLAQNQPAGTYWRIGVEGEGFAVYENVAEAAVYIDTYPSLSGPIGRFKEYDADPDWVDIETDIGGNMVRGLTEAGVTHFAALRMGPLGSAPVMTLTADGYMGVDGGFSPTPGVVYRTLDAAAGTTFHGAAFVETDAAGNVIKAIYEDGSSFSTETGTAPPEPGTAVATFVQAVSLPDGARGQCVPYGGFTCTGLDRISRGQFAGCWLVGNDGRTDEADLTFSASVVILSPDFRRIVKEIAVEGGDFGTPGSVQGVAHDASGDGNTAWIAAVGTDEIFQVDLLTDAVLATLSPAFGINGLARHATDGLWVGEIGTTDIHLISTVDASIIRTVAVSDQHDQIGYDETTDRLYITRGSNGSDGSLDVHDGTSGALVKTFASLSLCQAIEGAFMDFTRGKFWILNDGSFHVIAEPPLALACEFDFIPEALT